MEEPVDDFTKRIMERARERREMLTKKMADNSTRKRSSPLSNNQLDNIIQPAYTEEDSPNKRYCSRDEENTVHSDTPAIVGVKSRMQNLMDTRKQWFNAVPQDEDGENQMQVDNKDISKMQQPNFEESPAPPRSGRKARFAALADSVNKWEDDLSHPEIKQDTKPKKVWQPPKVEQTTTSIDVPSKSPRTYENDGEITGKAFVKNFNGTPRRFVSPAREPLEDAMSPPKMNKTESIQRSTKTVVSSCTVMLGVANNQSAYVAVTPSSRSPNKATSASSILRKSPLGSVVYQSPVRSTSTTSISLEKSPGKTYESKSETITMPSPKFVRKDFNHLTNSNRRDSDVHEPTKKPVSARLASWQQKVEGVETEKKTEVKTVYKTPNKGGVKLPASMSKPLSSIPKDVNASIANDPLNMSIHSRMNVWENKIFESNNEKEINDQIMYNTPKGRQMSGSSIQNSASSTKMSSARLGSATSTSTCATGSPVKTKSPGKNIATSPGKLGEGTKSIHEKLSALQQKWSNNEIAEKIKQQKETELEQVKNRWKNGVLQEEDNRQKLDPRDVPDVVSEEAAKHIGIPAAPPPPAVSGRSDKQSASPRKKSPRKQKSSNPKREADKNEMRKENDEIMDESLTTDKNFEDKLQMMGFELNTSHTAVVDLTPYKKKEKIAKANRAVSPYKQPTTKIEVEEIKTTSVKFDDKEKVTITRNKVTTPYTDHGSVSSTMVDNSNYNAVCTPARPPIHPTSVSSSTGTPSIYSLIKKNTAVSVPTSPFARLPAASPGVSAYSGRSEYAKSPSNGERDSFSDDSFESVSTMETDEPVPVFKQPSPVKRYTPVKQPSPHRIIKCDTAIPNYGGSQLSLTSATSEYSETQTDDYTSQDDESEYTEATETTQSSEDEDEGDVSDLLDEVLSAEESEDDEESEDEGELRTSTGRVEMRANSTKRNYRPISQPPEENRRAQNTTDYYKSTGQRNSAPSQPDKRVKFASEYSETDYTTQSTSGSESEKENKATLAYSIDNYRHSKTIVNAPVPKMTIVRQPEYHRKEPVMDTVQQSPFGPPNPDKKRLQALQDQVNQEQSVIMQTSNALNQCCGQNMQFAGSQEAVECHKLLLIACKKREAYINEMHRIKHSPPEVHQGPQGSLTVSNISLPLKQEFKRNIGGPNDLSVHYFLLLLRHRDHVVFTQLVSTHNEIVKDSLDIPNLIKFKDIKQDFKVDVEVYGMVVTREAANQTPSKKKKSGPFTPKKLMKKGAIHIQSPGGPSAVRSTNFVLVAHMQLNARSQGKTHFMLENVPFLSPLHGSIHLRMQCLIESNVEERGFLTMFEDVSGFGAWHRRWFALKQGFVSFWKYPDDERCKEPLGYFDLKQCITDAVGLIPRDICARPNTFELITVRRQGRGEKDTLVSRVYNTMTTTKLWLSADTKEERVLWCNRLNEALTNIRTWNSDALRPIKQNDIVTPYNPYPSKSDQRECIIPFNPHDQQSTC